jgi:alkylhydroperoxidase/carboxymuconolactone decarboxylase family protein YurZ
MHGNWSKLIAELKAPLRELRSGVPEVMKGFAAMAQAATKANALDSKTKEVVALAIEVAPQFRTVR